VQRDDVNVGELIAKVIASWPKEMEGRMLAAVDDPTLCRRVERWDLRTEFWGDRVAATDPGPGFIILCK
jgi:hypothetical protein